MEVVNLCPPHFSTCKVLFLGFLSYSLKDYKLPEIQFNSIHSNVVWGESENHIFLKTSLLFFVKVYYFSYLVPILKLIEELVI